MPDKSSVRTKRQVMLGTTPFLDKQAGHTTFTNIAYNNLVERTMWTVLDTAQFLITAWLIGIF